MVFHRMGMSMGLAMMVVVSVTMGMKKSMVMEGVRYFMEHGMDHIQGITGEKEKDHPREEVIR